MHSLADRFGVAVSTVHHHLEQFRAENRRNMRDTVADELERVRQIMEFAWKQIDALDEPEVHETIKEHLLKTTDDAKVVERITKQLRGKKSAQWMNVVQWGLEFFAKCNGHFVTRHQVEAKNEFRVAGCTREKITEEAARKFAEAIDRVRNERKV